MINALPIFLLVCLCLSWIGYIAFGPTLIETMYDQTMPIDFLNRVFDAQGEFPVAHYIEKADIAMIYLSGLAAIAAFLLLAFQKKLPLKSMMAPLGCAGFAYILWVTSSFGAYLTDDSADYFSASLSLLAGKGYLNYDGTPMAYWPPLFPTVLAGLKLIGLEAATAARLFNSAVFGLLIFAIGCYLDKHLKQKWLVYLGMCMIMTSFPLIYISIAAWSEPLFCLLILVSIHYLERFFQKNDWRPLITAACFLAAACMQRYAGIFLALSGGFVILFFARPSNVLQRVKYAFAFGLIPAVPFVLWSLRTYRLTSTLTGSRPFHTFDLQRSGYFFTNALSGWFIPGQIPYVARLLLLIVLFLFVIMSCVKIYQRNRDLISQKWPALGFIFFYAGFLTVYAALYSDFDISRRLLAPLYPFVIMLILFSVDYFCQRPGISDTQKKIRKTTIFIVILVWLAYPVVRLADRTLTFLQYGAGTYTTKKWQESETINNL